MLLLGVLMGLVVLWLRLVQLQVIGHDRFRVLSYFNYRTHVPIPAERGRIYDRKGEILAISVPGRSVFANPAEISDFAATASALAAITGVEQAQLHQLFLAFPEKHFVWVKRLVTPAEQAAVRAARIRGVYLREEPQRFYPNGSLAAQVLGFTGIDGDGLAGVESAMDARLAGIDGYREEGRDGLARSICSPSAVFIPAVNGHSVVLTIDTNIQDFLETAVERCNQQYAPLSVTGIVMDPNTGDILALAERPTFDPNSYADSDKETWRLRAVTDTFEPGSMFKPFVFSGALQERVVSLDETIFCGNGIYRVGARTLHDHHPYGNLTGEDIVVKSSNIGMAKVGQRLGAFKAYAFLSAFGFGRPTGVGFPGESAGYLAPPQRWTDYTVTSVPMGHEVSVTPLQVVAAFSAIANGGYLVKPRIVRGVISPEGNVLEKHTEGEILSQVLDAETARTMTKRVLRNVVKRGTGRLADIEEYELAGKTGTAQKLVNGVYSHTKYVSSFVAAGPVQDPKLVVLIVVDEPSRGASLFGGTVAAPHCAEVLKATLDYMYIDSRRRSPTVRLVSAEKIPARPDSPREVRRAP